MSAWRQRRRAAAPGRPGLQAADFLVAVAILVLLAGVALKLNAPGQATRLVGAVSVIDGDTVVIDGKRLRFKGIDAPERDQRCTRPTGDFRCGETARDVLVKLIGREPVRCEGSRTDRYQRLLVMCFKGQVDLGETMVAEGWAVSYGGYTAAEQRARTARVGLWAGTFEQRQQWRRTHGDVEVDGYLSTVVEIISKWLSGNRDSGTAP